MPVIIGRPFRKLTPNTLYYTTIIAASPTLYWKLDESGPFTTGYIANDSSGNNLHGVYMNGALITNEVSLVSNDAGNSKYFPDSANQYVSGTIDTFQSLVFPFTLEIWFDVDLTQTNYLFASNAGAPGYSGMEVTLIADGNVQVGFGDGSGLASAEYRKTYRTTTAPLTANQKTHLVAVCTDMDTVTLYINGSQIPVSLYSGTGTSLGVNGTGTYPVVSSSWVGGNLNTKGYIDEVAFYLYELTALQITEHYGIGAGTI